MQDRTQSVDRRHESKVRSGLVSYTVGQSGLRNILCEDGGVQEVDLSVPGTKVTNDRGEWILDINHFNLFIGGVYVIEGM